MKKKKVIKKKPVKKLIVLSLLVTKEIISNVYLEDKNSLIVFFSITTFDIISLVTNKDRTIKEIVFSYTGTLLIPKSLKEFHPPNKSSVTGTHVVNSKSKPILQTTDYMSISKSDMIWNLKESLRKDYILGMKEIIDNEIIPEKNIVVDLPW